MGFGELEADNGESPGWQKAAALVDGQPHRSNKPRSVQQWLSNKVFQLDLVTGAGVMESTERMVFYSILVALLACAVYTTIVFMPTQSAEFAASVLSYVKLLKGKPNALVADAASGTTGTNLTT